MSPKLAMQEMVSQVETSTGYPVTIQMDPALTVMATSKAARGNIPFNLIRLRPDLSNIKEYAVCFQCGFILRQALLPPQNQWEITASESAVSEIEAAVRETVGSKLSEVARRTFAQLMVDGIVTQLRSVPIGLRVDQCLSERYEVLSIQQRDSVTRQLNENLSILSPKVKGMAPENIYAASAGMNSAFAAYWATLWGDNTIALPYELSGFVEISTTLVSLLREIPTESDFDQSLIDSWATELGIPKWHAFVSRQEL